MNAKIGETIKLSFDDTINCMKASFTALYISRLIALMATGPLRSQVMVTYLSLLSTGERYKRLAHDHAVRDCL